MPIYTVEIDGKQYDIEGDRPPTEAEARSAIGAHTGAPATPPPVEAAAAAPPEKGPVRRFLEPIGEAAKAALIDLPTAAVGAVRDNPALLTGPGAFLLNPGKTAEQYGAVAEALLGPNVEQGRQAAQAASEGRISEAVGHGAAAAIPLIGPAAAEVGETLGEGNVAGALGQAAVNLAPLGKVPIKPTSMAAMLRNRAAKRILDVMRPAKSAVAGAEDVAEDLVMGLPERQTAGGIGVGNLETLAARAKERASAAGREIEAFQALDTPIDTAPVSAALRDRAAGLTTFGPSDAMTGHPALVKALGAEAQFIDDLAAQYPDAKVPAGELFKQRGAMGRRVAKSYQQAPGVEAAAGMEAGKASRDALSRLLHDEVPASQIADREYRVFRTAWQQIESHRRGSLTNRGLKGLKDLLAGRAAGAAMGAGVGGLGMGPLGGVAGALAGVVLGESAYWGSLRAATYAKLAKALNSGALDTAADILQRSIATYAMDRGINDAERNRAAQDALRSQAEGVIAP